MDLTALIGLVSGVLGIISFMAMDGDKKLKAFVFCIVFSVAFWAGNRLNQPNSVTTSKGVAPITKQEPDSKIKDITTEEWICTYTFPNRTPPPRKFNGEREFSKSIIHNFRFLPNGRCQGTPTKFYHIGWIKNGDIIYIGSSNDNFIDRFFGTTGFTDTSEAYLKLYIQSDNKIVTFWRRETVDKNSYTMELVDKLPSPTSIDIKRANW
jgi:hypothetical protein